jgi:WD40 repeat protein
VRGHAEHAVFSADGRRLLIVSGGGTVQLWEAASGSWAGDEPRHVAQRELADYDFPAAAKTGATQFGLSAAALSPDGRTAVVGGSYKHAFVWRPDGEPALVALGAREAERGPGGEELLKRDGHAGQVMGIALSEDLGRVWTATWTGRLLEWQLDGPEPRATELIRRAGANWTGLRGLEDGSLLLWGVVTGAAGATMDTVRVSDRGEKLGSWSLPAAARAIYPRPVAVSLATRRVVAASAGTAGLWDLDDGTRIPLPGRDVGHFMAGLSPDGAIAATADSDGRVRLSDAEDGAFRIELSALARAVRGLCFAPDSRRVVVANTDLELLVYGIDGVLQQRLNGSGHDSIAGLGFSPDGSFLTLGGGDGVVRVWDLSSARRPVAISTGYLEPGRLAVAPDGRVVAFATGDDRIWRWELDTGEVTPIGQHVGTDSVRFTADGRVLSGGGGRDPRLSQAMLWGDDPTEPVWRMPPAAQFIGVSVAEVPTRNAVLVALGRNYVKPPEVQVWSLDAAATAPLRVLRGPDAMPRINHADVSPDGTRVAVAGFDGLVRVWDLGLDEGGPVERVASDEVRFEPRGGPVQHVRFDPSGTRVVFGCGDGTVHIGSLADGSAMSLTGHTKRTVGVRFADDGRLVLSGSMDGTARVWDASTGAELCRFDIGASSGVWDVGWIPARDGNGPRVVAASADGRLSTWIVDRAELHGMARAAILR